MADVATSASDVESARRREQKIVALVQEVSRALSTGGDLDALLRLIMEKVTVLMEADRSTLFLVTEDGRQLWSKDIQGGALVELRLDVGEGGAGASALVVTDGSLRFRSVQGPAAPRLIERTLPHGTGRIGWSIAHKMPLSGDEPGNEPRHAVAIARETGVT